MHTTVPPVVLQSKGGDGEDEKEEDGAGDDKESAVIATVSASGALSLPLAGRCPSRSLRVHRPIRNKSQSSGSLKRFLFPHFCRAQLTHERALFRAMHLAQPVRQPAASTSKPAPPKPKKKPADARPARPALLPGGGDDDDSSDSEGGRARAKRPAKPKAAPRPAVKNSELSSKDKKERLAALVQEKAAGAKKRQRSESPSSSSSDGERKGRERGGREKGEASAKGGGFAFGRKKPINPDEVAPRQNFKAARAPFTPCPKASPRVVLSTIASVALTPTSPFLLHAPFRRSRRRGPCSCRRCFRSSSLRVTASRPTWCARTPHGCSSAPQPAPAPDP